MFLKKTFFFGASLCASNISIWLHSTYTLSEISWFNNYRFWNSAPFRKTKRMSYPPKAGLIEYWLEELLVAASKEGEEGGRGKIQQQQVKLVFLNSHPQTRSHYEIFWNFWRYWFRKPGKPGSQPSSPSTGVRLAHSEFWHTPTLVLKGFFFVLTACLLPVILSQIGLTASLLALIVERVVHAAKSKPHLLINSWDIECPLWKKQFIIKQEHWSIWRSILSHLCYTLFLIYKSEEAFICLQSEKGFLTSAIQVYSL